MPIYKSNGKKDGLQKYNVRINYISENGEAKQLTRVAFGLDNAKTLELRLNDEIKNKNVMPIRKMTVQELFEEYKSVKKHEIRETSFIKLQEDFNRYILPMFNTYRIDKINAGMLQNWKNFMKEKGLSLGTNKLIFVIFKSLFIYAVKMEYLTKNPFNRIDNFKDSNAAKREMKFYTTDEFRGFISKARDIAETREGLQNDFSEWNYYVFFNIAFYTGARKGEIHALKWSDIDGSYLTIKRSIFQRRKGEDIETLPKNKSSIRTLQMPLPLIEILYEHKKRQQKLHNFTDDFRICGNIRDFSIQERNKKYSLEAGLKTIRIHDFRHSHVSALANANINIQEIARRLGHSRIEMTWNTYCHLYPREEEKAVMVFNQPA